MPNEESLNNKQVCCMTYIAKVSKSNIPDHKNSPTVL